MRIIIRGNFRKAAMALAAAASKVPAASDAGAKAVGLRVREGSLEMMEPLYWVADPGLVATGRGFLGIADAGWNRIGALRAAESLQRIGPSAFILTTSSSPGVSEIMDDFARVEGSIAKDPADYAEWRYYQGREVGSRWRERGYQNVAHELPDIFEDEFSSHIPGALITR